jgi:hypothetical protein
VDHGRRPLEFEALEHAVRVRCDETKGRRASRSSLLDPPSAGLVRAGRKAQIAIRRSLPAPLQVRQGNQQTVEGNPDTVLASQSRQELELGLFTRVGRFCSEPADLLVQRRLRGAGLGVGVRLLQPFWARGVQPRRGGPRLASFCSGLALFCWVRFSRRLPEACVGERLGRLLVGHL